MGHSFLSLVHLSKRSLEVAGGVLLPIIALRTIFSSGGEAYEPDISRVPFVFPLAVPLLAEPSAMATVLLAAERVRRWLGDSMVAAIEKLMGLVLTAVAMEMILAGLKRDFFEPN